jgi:hypothetical protein
MGNDIVAHRIEIYIDLEKNNSKFKLVSLCFVVTTQSFVVVFFKITYCFLSGIMSETTPLGLTERHLPLHPPRMRN